MTRILALAVVAIVSADARADDRTCHRHEIVGVKGCTRFLPTFGTWAEGQPLAFELGGAGRSLLLPALVPVNVRGQQVGLPPQTHAFDTRLRISFGGWLFVAAELEVGDAHLGPPYSIVERDYVAIQAGLGVRYRFGSHLSAAVEVAPGAQRLGEEHIHKPLLELRGQVDTWVTPRITIGVSYGQSLVDLVQSSVALTFGLHVRAFDGVR